jgi:ATP-binding cassette subfamily B (MDR/TAP) protein 1
LFLRGILFGLSQFLVFGVYAFTFYVGSELVARDGLTMKNFFTALFAVIFAAVGAGASQQSAGNLAEAELASNRIFGYLDVENKIKYQEHPSTMPIKGEIRFRNVKFTYPQRKQPCFQDLNFTIYPMQKVAFAGPSGGGKSTIFGLLYRFYDVDEGQILIDGVDIKDYDIKHLRSSFGMVSQEPTLFNSTIRYNIKYNQPERTDAEMEEAAEIANATSFIKYDEALGGHKDTQTQGADFSTADKESTARKDQPKEEEEDGHGFDRKVGLKGSKLSGGQKQRVAIARTVIRRPEVYMFDESTSALDTASEKIVQDALNKLSAQKTSLAIAHRISTIKDSDVIFVIEGGKVVEQGKFDELLARKGAFYQLNKDK